MRTTVTVHWNKGVIADEHNQRKEELCKHEPHIDLYNKHGKSSHKQLFRKELKQVYTEIFALDIEEYNSKVKKYRRKTIESYMQEIENDTRGKKQTKRVNGKKVIDENADRKGKQLWYEVTIKIGNTERERDEFGRTIYDENNHHIRKEYLPKELQQQILEEYHETFQENNPNFILVSSDLHADEGFYNRKGQWEYDIDHLHLCFVPVAHFAKGLHTQNSMNKALREMGCNSYDSWAKKEQARLEEIVHRKYKEYCEANPDFYAEHGKLEIYHPISEKTRQGDMNKQQYIMYQELQDQAGELENERQTYKEEIEEELLNEFTGYVREKEFEFDTKSKTLHRELEQKKTSDEEELKKIHEENMKKLEESKQQFVKQYQQKIQENNDYIDNQKKKIKEEKEKVQKQALENVTKSKEIADLEEDTRKRNDEAKKRLQQANSGSERVMASYIRTRGLYNDFLDFCEDYFENDFVTKSNYDYQY